MLYLEGDDVNMTLLSVMEGWEDDLKRGSDSKL